jgi:hypothetical protein
MMVRGACAAILVACLLGCSDERPPPWDGVWQSDAGPSDTPCVLADPPEDVVVDLQGGLAGAEFYSCAWPDPGSETAEFTGPTAETAVVSGAPLELPLEWVGADSLDGRNLYVSYVGLGGYFVLPAPSSDNPLPFQIFVTPTAADGERRFQFAIDDGASSPDAPNLGPTLSINVYTIQVGTGDVQINLHWDKFSDLDLYVTDPANDLIFFGTRSSTSGGTLDLDSYSACNTTDRGRGNENVFWPEGAAPTGQYTVEVNMWGACGTATTGEDTHYRVTVIVDRTDIRVFDGVMTPADASGGVERRPVTTFTYPP